MRLTQALWRIAPKLPRGHMYRGKNRIVRPVTPKDVHELREDIKREEKNLFYIRNPYLTLEQTKGHAAVLQKHEKWLAKWKIEKESAFTKHKTLESELNHLKHSVDWDFKAGSS